MQVFWLVNCRAGLDAGLLIGKEIHVVAMNAILRRDYERLKDSDVGHAYGV